MYWETIRDNFPLQVDRLPNLGDETFFLLPPLRRVWFLSEDEKRLVQLQDNYFGYNWSQEDGEEYPHFDKIFTEFLKQWNHLKDWWYRYEEESIEPSGYELIYINKIDKDSGWFSAEDHHKIFTFISKGFERSLETPKFIDFQTAFSLPNNEGRLSLTVDQRIQESDEPNDENDENNGSDFVIFRLNASSFNTDSEIEHWFRSAHNYVLKAFLELTEEAQQKWGRYEH